MEVSHLLWILWITYEHWTEYRRYAQLLTIMTSHHRHHRKDLRSDFLYHLPGHCCVYCAVIRQIKQSEAHFVHAAYVMAKIQPRVMCPCAFGYIVA